MSQRHFAEEARNIEVGQDHGFHRNSPRTLCCDYPGARRLPPSGASSLPLKALVPRSDVARGACKGIQETRFLRDNDRQYALGWNAGVGGSEPTVGEGCHAPLACGAHAPRNRRRLELASAAFALSRSLDPRAPRARFSRSWSRPQRTSSWLVVGLTATMMVAEIVGGIVFGSMAPSRMAGICQPMQWQLRWPLWPISTRGVTPMIHVSRLGRESRRACRLCDKISRLPTRRKKTKALGLLFLQP